MRDWRHSRKPRCEPDGGYALAAGFEPVLGVAGLRGVAGFLSAVLAALARLAGDLAAVRPFVSTGVLSAVSAGASDSWCNLAISRDLRRAAALGWTMPRCAARSSARTAARTATAASSTLLATAWAAFFTYVRTADRAAWLRTARRWPWRHAFCADFVFANLGKTPQNFCREYNACSSAQCPTPSSASGTRST